MSGSLRVLLATLVAAVFAVCVAHAAPVDPPGRVARLSDMQGRVSFAPAGEDAWFGVVRNRPLVRGDRLWVDRGGRAELQVGSAVFRLAPGTGVEILELDDRIVQLQLTEGALNVRALRIHQGQSIEIATPLLAFVIDEPGRYRIDVDRRGEETAVAVHEGGGTAYGERASFPIEAGESVRFFDTDLRDYAIEALPPLDGFDRYAMERDRRLDRSVSLRYVDPDLIGYADLDDHGRWQQTADYGAIWFPNRVGADWAPYRDGRWIWQEPWGWTWVDDAPWGFAPSHYGRWVHVSNRWGWMPGPRNRRPVYAPALVAFVSGRGWNVSASSGTPVGWFPLGPRDVYVPSYRASRDYFARVNQHNARIEQQRLADLYGRYSGGGQRYADPGYGNRGIRGAVTVAPSTVFTQARPVRQELLRLDHEMVARGEIARSAPVVPSMQSIVGAGQQATPPPSADAFDRRVMARNAPPPELDPFAQRRRQLEQTPGIAPQWRGREGQVSDPNVQVVDPRGINARLGESRHGRGEGRRGGDDVAGGERRGDRGDRGERGERGRFDEQRPAAEQQRIVEQQAEQQRLQDEQLRVVEQQQAEQQRQRGERQRIVEQQQAEQQRFAEQQQAEQQRIAEQMQAEQRRQLELQQQQQAEQQRIAEQQQAEQRRQIEQQQQQAEQQRVAEQQQRELERQQAEQQRLAEEQQREQQRVAEQQQRELERQQAEQERQAEVERRIEEQRERMERRQREQEEQHAEQDQR